MYNPSTFVAVIGQTVSHYRILEEIRAGGMGVVYRAEDTLLRREVAIKFPKVLSNQPAFRSRFLREAQAASRLDHPNIARVYDYGETPDGQPFLVMELLRGQTLKDALAAGPLPAARAIEVVAAILTALAEAHREKLIHRDVKPSNVYLTERGEIKVLDFGLAKEISLETAGGEDSPTETLYTDAGAVMGTPQYMSPEQAMGKDLDERSDLFSTGLVLFECLSGRVAFSGRGHVDILGQVLHVDPPAPSSFNPAVPAELDRIVGKAIAKTPDQRYQSAEEFRADLAAAGQTEPPPRWWQLVAERLRTPVGRRVAAAVLVLVVGAVGWWVWRLIPYQPKPEAMRWYQDGLRALRDGTYHSASKALARSVQIDGRFTLARARLAEVWMELDYIDRARQEMLRALSFSSRSRLRSGDKLYVEAINCTLTRDFGCTIARYAELVRQASEADRAQVIVDLGRAYEKNEETKKALEQYREAARLDAQFAAAYLRTGILEGRGRRLDQAEKAFSQAEALYQASSNLEGQAEVYLQRGRLSSQEHKLAEARLWLDRALELAATIASEYQQVAARLQLSVVSSTEGNTDRAEKEVRQALDQAQRAGMTTLAARGLMNHGSALFLRADYVRADQTFREALAYSRHNELRRQEAGALLSLGSLHIQQGKLEEGLREVEEALRFYEAGGYRRETGDCLILIARARRQKGDYDGALAAFRRQLEVAEEIQFRPHIALALQGMGTVLFEQERLPEALEQFRRAHAIGVAMGAKVGMGYSLMHSAKVLERLGRFEEADQAAAEAVTLASQPGAGIPALLTSTTIVRAEVALGRGRFNESTAAMRSVLSSPDLQPQTTADARSILALALLRSGARKQALVESRRAVEAARESGNPYMLSKAQLAFAEVAADNNELRAALAALGQAQAAFGKTGQKESAWRAWVVDARARRRSGDAAGARQSLILAEAAVRALEKTWGAEDFKKYLARADIQNYSRELRRSTDGQP